VAAGWRPDLTRGKPDNESIAENLRIRGPEAQVCRKSMTAGLSASAESAHRLPLRPPRQAALCPLSVGLGMHEW
jgi:hypothetical protein